MFISNQMRDLIIRLIEKYTSDNFMVEQDGKEEEEMINISVKDSDTLLEVLVCLWKDIEVSNLFIRLKKVEGFKIGLCCRQTREKVSLNFIQLSCDGYFLEQEVQMCVDFIRCFIGKLDLLITKEFKVHFNFVYNLAFVSLSRLLECHDSNRSSNHFSFFRIIGNIVPVSIQYLSNLRRRYPDQLPRADIEIIDAILLSEWDSDLSLIFINILFNSVSCFKKRHFPLFQEKIIQFVMTTQYQDILDFTELFVLSICILKERQDSSWAHLIRIMYSQVPSTAIQVVDIFLLHQLEDDSFLRQYLLSVIEDTCVFINEYLSRYTNSAMESNVKYYKTLKKNYIEFEEVPNTPITTIFDLRLLYLIQQAIPIANSTENNIRLIDEDETDNQQVHVARCFLFSTLLLSRLYCLSIGTIDQENSSYDSNSSYNLLSQFSQNILVSVSDIAWNIDYNENDVFLRNEWTIELRCRSICNLFQTLFNNLQVSENCVNRIRSEIKSSDKNPSYFVDQSKSEKLNKSYLGQIGNEQWVQYSNQRQIDSLSLNELFILSISNLFGYIHPSSQLFIFSYLVDGIYRADNGVETIEIEFKENPHKIEDLRTSTNRFNHVFHESATFHCLYEILTCHGDMFVGIDISVVEKLSIVISSRDDIRLTLFRLFCDITITISSNILFSGILSVLSESLHSSDITNRIFSIRLLCYFLSIAPVEGQPIILHTLSTAFSRGLSERRVLYFELINVLYNNHGRMSYNAVIVLQESISVHLSKCFDDTGNGSIVGLSSKNFVPSSCLFSSLDSIRSENEKILLQEDIAQLTTLAWVIEFILNTDESLSTIKLLTSVMASYVNVSNYLSLNSTKLNTAQSAIGSLLSPVKFLNKSSGLCTIYCYALIRYLKYDCSYSLSGHTSIGYIALSREILQGILNILLLAKNSSEILELLQKNDVTLSDMYISVMTVAGSLDCLLNVACHESFQNKQDSDIASPVKWIVTVTDHISFIQAIERMYSETIEGNVEYQFVGYSDSNLGQFFEIFFASSIRIFKSNYIEKKIGSKFLSTFDKLPIDINFESPKISNEKLSPNLFFGALKYFCSFYRGFEGEVEESEMPPLIEEFLYELSLVYGLYLTMGAVSVEKKCRNLISSYSLKLRKIKEDVLSLIKKNVSISALDYKSDSSNEYVFKSDWKGKKSLSSTLLNTIDDFSDKDSDDDSNIMSNMVSRFRHKCSENPTELPEFLLLFCSRFPFKYQNTIQHCDIPVIVSSDDLKMGTARTLASDNSFRYVPLMTEMEIKSSSRHTVFKTRGQILITLERLLFKISELFNNKLRYFSSGLSVCATTLYIQIMEMMSEIAIDMNSSIKRGSTISVLKKFLDVLRRGCEAMTAVEIVALLSNDKIDTYKCKKEGIINSTLSCVSHFTERKQMLYYDFMSIVFLYSSNDSSGLKLFIKVITDHINELNGESSSSVSSSHTIMTDKIQNATSLDLLLTAIVQQVFQKWNYYMKISCDSGSDSNFGSTDEEKNLILDNLFKFSLMLFQHQELHKSWITRPHSKKLYKTSYTLYQLISDKHSGKALGMLAKIIFRVTRDCMSVYSLITKLRRSVSKKSLNLSTFWDDDKDNDNNVNDNNPQEYGAKSFTLRSGDNLANNNGFRCLNTFLSIINCNMLSDLMKTLEDISSGDLQPLKLSSIASTSASSEMKQNIYSSSSIASNSDNFSSKQASEVIPRMEELLWRINLIIEILSDHETNNNASYTTQTVYSDHLLITIDLFLSKGRQLVDGTFALIGFKNKKSAYEKKTEYDHEEFEEICIDQNSEYLDIRGKSNYRERVPLIGNKRLRSRNKVIDKWLQDENGQDTYADLEDFIV